jgi:hypothetical protein
VKRQGPIAQERLGHANIAMTLDLYSHVTVDMQRQAAKKFQAALVDLGERIVRHEPPRPSAPPPS